MLRSISIRAAGVAAAAAILGLVLVASAQQQPDRQQREQQRTTRQAGDRVILTEQHLAACLIVDNQGEIELAEFAQQQAQGEEAKQFAQQMVQDHTEFVSKLQQFAGPIGAGLSTRPQVRGQSEAENRNDRAAPQEGAEQREEPAAQAERGQRGATGRQAGRQAAEGQGVELLTLKQELSQKCLQSTKEALGEKQGAEFDKAYLMTQCFAHMQMIDALEVFSGHASPEFRAVLTEGRETAQKHLDHCKTLCKQLEGQTAAPRTAERPDDQQE